MKKTGKDIKELLADIPVLHYTPEIRMDCPEDRKKVTVERIVNKIIAYKKNGNSRCHIVELDTTDGVRIVFENGWGLVRTSNTQPVVVMRVEANSAENLESYRAFLEEEFRMAGEEAGI
jgi:phosphomannomutase/phosphoglucomutase